jgi:hypothetical protein
MVVGSHQLCNREFCRALRDLRGFNILALIADGSAVFGRLEAIDDWVAFILPAAGITGVVTVRYRPPSVPLVPDILLSEMLVDVCDIVAVIEGPYLVSPLSKSDAQLVGALPVETKAAVMVKPNMTRQQQTLVDVIDDFSGQNLGLLLLGGWVIAGQVGDMCDYLTLTGPSTVTSVPPLLILGSLNIFGPALEGGALNLYGTYRALANLKTMLGTMFP